MSEQQPTDGTPTNGPAIVAHHWIMTVQSADGRQGTSDGNIDVIPGVHTDEATYSRVLNGMREWIGSENITVLFYRLAPSTIAAPGGAA
ncbi:hypothetical protein O3Q52_36170 [Streptomyces sp. ActVer]|uniref:hypothetical protein n=1 Tax=Streptomyces sp. ActVer TaxID=3014558 RepID=UPI0022B40F63|nr:hypothetical protein [Streptomyces sp. ActVer]MCZ4513491.1 hypothetical protein [Streptomyces sp. ActVer]